MTAILDTSFLFALTDQGDRNHQRVLAIAQSVNEPLVLPVVVLPESCYLIASRLGHQAMRRFVSSMTPDAVQADGRKLLVLSLSSSTAAALHR
jgi:predicted nucleic acid-binding protein